MEIEFNHGGIMILDWIGLSSELLRSEDMVDIYQFNAVHSSDQSRGHSVPSTSVSYFSLEK